MEYVDRLHTAAFEQLKKKKKRKEKKEVHKSAYEAIDV